MADNKDPFSEFGGSEVKIAQDPFAEFGGEPVKKNEPTTVSPEQSTSGLQTVSEQQSGSGAGDEQLPPIDLPKEYERTEPSTYKNLIGGRRYKLTQGGKPIVGTWDEKTQTFIKDPLINPQPQVKKTVGFVEAIEVGMTMRPPVETREEAFGRAAMESDKVYSEVKQKVKENSDLMIYPAVQRYAQLQDLYSKTDDDNIRSKIKAEIDRIKNANVADEGILGAQISTNETPVYTESYIPQLPPYKELVATNEKLPKINKTVSEAYNQMLSNIDFIEQGTSEVNEFESSLINYLVSKLPEEKQKELSSISDESEYNAKLEEALVESKQEENVVAALFSGLTHKMSALSDVGSNLGLDDETLAKKKIADIKTKEIFGKQPKGTAAEISSSIGGMLPDIFAGTISPPLMMGSMLSTMPNDFLEQSIAEDYYSGRPIDIKKAKQYAGVSTVLQGGMLIGAGKLGSHGLKLMGSNGMKRVGQLFYEIGKRGTKDAVIFGALGTKLQNEINKAYSLSENDEYLNAMVHMFAIGGLFAAKEGLPQLNLTDRQKSEIDYIASYLPSDYTRKQVKQLIEKGFIAPSEGEVVSKKLDDYRTIVNEIPSSNLTHQQIDKIYPSWLQKQELQKKMQGATTEIKNVLSGQIAELDRKILVDAAIPLTAEEKAELKKLTSDEAQSKSIDKTRKKYLEQRKHAADKVAGEKLQAEEKAKEEAAKKEEEKAAEEQDNDIEAKKSDIERKIQEDFNNENEFYRVIVGDEAFNDIVESGVVRTNHESKVKSNQGIDLSNRPTAFPSFSKGKASMEYAAENPNNYIIVTEDSSIQPSKYGRHGKGTTMFPTGENGNNLKELSGEKVKVYKHIGNGEYILVYANGKLINAKYDAELSALKPKQEAVAEQAVVETPAEKAEETTTETEVVKPTPDTDIFSRASDKKIRMAELMDGSLDADIIPKTSKEEFTTITEKAIMPDGEDGVKVTLQKPDGEKVELGVMYPEDVETEVAKKIRGYKLQQAKPETTTEPQAEQPATDFTGKNVTFEHAGSDVTGVVVGTDEKGNLKVKDARGINYTVKPEKATTIDEITAAKNEFAEALKDFREATDITKLGIKGTDPQAQAEAMYKIHKALVRMAKAYIAKGTNDVKKFASAVGITAKQAQQAWDEAMGNAKYAAEDLAYDVADLTKTAIRRGINVRERFAEYKKQQKDFKKAISDFINDAEIKKAISPTQVRALVSRAAKVTTEAQLDNFIDYAQKVIDNAEYSVEMDDIRDMQQKARKRNHVSFGNIVREFTSITPEKIPDNLLVAYKTALDGLMARVPSYKAMEEIFYEIAQANFKPDTFSNIQTYQQAQELYNQIALNKIGSIQEYRDLFKSINGFKRRVEQLFENGDITEDQRNDLIDQVGKDQAAVESKYASEITSLKTDLINEIRAKQKSTGISQLTTEEKKLLEEFYKLDNNDLRSLSPEELYNLSSILDNVMEEGRVDVFRLSPLVNRAKAASEATQLQQQVAKAKPFQNIKKSVEEVVKKMGMTYSSFWENTLGLGAVNYGAFQKYVVAPMERAIGSYRRDVQEGYKAFNDLKKKYKVDTEEQMNKIGMIATYLREYGMSNDPKYKGKKDGKGNEFGTRDWFEFVLTDPETRGRMKTEEIEALQKLYDQLPKVNGKVSPEEVYNSFMANDGKFLSTNEMNFLKDAMDWRDKNMTGKQKYANELRGKPFEEVMFHIKRVRKGDTKAQAVTPVEVSGKRDNVRIAAGSGKEVTNNELGAVETNFEKLFAETLEENARDYHITPMLQKQNDVMNKAKEGLPDDKKSYIEVMKKNLASAINNEFQDAEANRLVTNLLKARAAQVLIAPIRTIGEVTAALVSYPLRSGNFSSYGELFKKRDAVTKLMKQSNSPFQNRVDLSRQFDAQKGNIKGEGWQQKASELFAALAERMGIEPVWMATFDAAFEKEAGVKFDRERYLNSAEYADKYNKAIEAAGAVADATYGQIAGSTTKAGSRRDVKILPEALTNNKLAKMLGIPESVQSKKTMGTLAAFMTGHPFREVEQVLKSGSALKEAIKGADYNKKDVAKTLMPPLGVALSAITYNYWQALSYQFIKMALGDEEEKEKAKEDIANLFTGRTAILETAATMLSTLGSRYSGFSRTAVSWLGALYYNLAEDEKDKQVAKDFVRNITYQDPFVLQMTKSGDVNRYMLKENLAWQTAQAVPAFGIVVDNAAKAMEAIGGAKYLQGKIERGEVLTEPEKEALVLSYVAVNMGNGVAQLFGYGLPATTINKMAKQILDKGKKENTRGSTRGSRF